MGMSLGYAESESMYHRAGMQQLPERLRSCWLLVALFSVEFCLFSKVPFRCLLEKHPLKKYPCQLESKPLKEVITRNFIGDY